MFQQGECVQIPDGRIGRVREKLDSGYRIRVKRISGKSHEFVLLQNNQLKKVACPKGWMSIDGYNRYLKITLSKMKTRLKLKK